MINIMNSNTSKDIHEYYIRTLEGTLEYDNFKLVCSEFNIMVMDRILEGEVFYMGNDLSSIDIIRVPMDGLLKINWGASNKRKKQLLKEGKTPYDEKTNPDGIKWFVYHDNDWMVTFRWRKTFCTLVNSSKYRFDPTRGAKGNKTKLVERLKSDDAYYLRFPVLRKVIKMKRK